jgi:hypothetical protein
LEEDTGTPAFDSVSWESYWPLILYNSLSPFLLILAIDTLQFILKKAADEGVLTPRRDRTPKLRLSLSLSLYADDAAVFVNLVKTDIDMIMEILHNFGEATGFRINQSKSTVPDPLWASESR